MASKASRGFKIFIKILLRVLVGHVHWNRGSLGEGGKMGNLSGNCSDCCVCYGADANDASYASYTSCWD